MSSVMGSHYMGPSLNNDSLSHFWGVIFLGFEGLEFRVRVRLRIHF